MSNVFMGVDPGKTGAACLLFRTVMDVTSHESRRREGIGLPWQFKFIDWPKDDSIDEVIKELHLVVLDDYEITHAALEQQQSMPKQGVKSTFTLGRNFGRWEALLTVLGIPFTIVTANAWRKGRTKKSDGPDPKARVKRYIENRFPRKRFPELWGQLYGPKGGYKDGRADALVIALWARDNA